MADDKPEDAGLAPESGRAKRTPPTIDLEATEVSTQPQEWRASRRLRRRPNRPRMSRPSPKRPSSRGQARELSRAAARTCRGAGAASVSPSISPWVIAPFSGAVAAAIVIARRLDAGLACRAGAAGRAASDGRSRRCAERARRRGRSQGGQACRRSGHAGADRCAGEIRNGPAQRRRQSARAVRQDRERPERREIGAARCRARSCRSQRPPRSARARQQDRACRTRAAEREDRRREADGRQAAAPCGRGRPARRRRSPWRSLYSRSSPRRGRWRQSPIC